MTRSPNAQGGHTLMATATTYSTILDAHSVTIPAHLEAQAEVPATTPGSAGTAQ